MTGRRTLLPGLLLALVQAVAPSAACRAQLARSAAPLNHPVKVCLFGLLAPKEVRLAPLQSASLTARSGERRSTLSLASGSCRLSVEGKDKVSLEVATAALRGLDRVTTTRGRYKLSVAGAADRTVEGTLGFVARGGAARVLLELAPGELAEAVALVERQPG
ncbi:MAG: hypothetical protein HY303_09625, partial [Candidatus Wallbacteria bacterium]|nr:hypothetical protein [Candidatus Wallbacteria bacterium]